MPRTELENSVHAVTMNSGYLSLLRWSLSAQDARDGTAPSTATQMSAEDRAWLKEALESSMVDSITSMKLLVKVLQLVRC